MRVALEWNPFDDIRETSLFVGGFKVFITVLAGFTRLLPSIMGERCSFYGISSVTKLH
jgi:hypothetical protein